MSRGPFRSQLRAELGVVLRNGEQLLLTLIIPVMVLVFFGITDVPDWGGEDYSKMKRVGVAK